VAPHGPAAAATLQGMRQSQHRPQVFRHRLRLAGTAVQLMSAQLLTPWPSLIPRSAKVAMRLLLISLHEKSCGCAWRALPPVIPPPQSVSPAEPGSHGPTHIDWDGAGITTAQLPAQSGVRGGVIQFKPAQAPVGDAVVGDAVAHAATTFAMAA
jgi:hypothetical protein